MQTDRALSKKLYGVKALTRGLSLLLVLPISLGMIILSPGNRTIAPAQALVGSEDNPVEIRQAALDCLLREDLEGAMDSYNNAIESATRHYGEDSLFLAELYYEAGALALRMDLFEPADKYLTQAIKINPRLAMARLTLAEVNRKRERPMDALAQIQSELSSRPDSIIARQQFIRWLGANAKNPTDHSIANQESLRLLAMTSQVKQNRIKAQQSGNVSTLKVEDTKAGSPASSAASYKPSSVKSASVKNSAAKAESETVPAKKEVSKASSKEVTKVEAKTDVKHDKDSSSTKTLPTFGFGMSKFVKEKAEKAKKLEAEKLEKEKREQAAREKTDREKADRERAERERAEKERREKERRDREKKASKLDNKKVGDKKSVEKKVEEPPVKEDKAKKDNKDKPKSKPVPVEEATPAQTQQTMPPMQPFYQPVPILPFMNSPAQKKGKPGLVPPPPPTMPMYPGMAPPPVQMIIPVQQQAEKPKPKPKPKPVKVEETPKETQEDKPPPMTTGADSDPDFILDWVDVKKKKKN